MLLARVDETDLLLPLYAGVNDTSQWHVFLSRLQRRTSADHATLLLHRVGRPRHDTFLIFSGRNPAQQARSLSLERLLSSNLLSHASLRAGRVYRLAELEMSDPIVSKLHDDLRALGFTDERIAPLPEHDGTSGWLFLIRGDGDFTAADGALATALLPHMGMATRGFVLSQRQAVRAQVAMGSLERAGIGWATFGHDAQPIELSPALATLLGHNLTQLQSFGSPAVRRALTAAAIAFDNDPDAVPHVIALSQEPRIDALLTCPSPAVRQSLSSPAVVAYCRLPGAQSAVRPGIVAALFGLSAREAELAVLLCEGLSLSDAAAAMGIREDTVRGYSKAIYAKMAVQGQAQMMQRIFLSVATLV